MKFIMLILCTCLLASTSGAKDIELIPENGLLDSAFFESGHFKVLAVNRMDMTHSIETAILSGGMLGKNAVEVPLCLTTDSQEELLNTLAYAMDNNTVANIIYQEDLGKILCIEQAFINE